MKKQSKKKEEEGKRLVWKKLMTEHGYVQQHSDFKKWFLKGDHAYKDYQWIILGGDDHQNYKNEDGFKWSLVAAPPAQRRPS